MLQDEPVPNCKETLIVQRKRQCLAAKAELNQRSAFQQKWHRDITIGKTPQSLNVNCWREFTKSGLQDVLSSCKRDIDLLVDTTKQQQTFKNSLFGRYMSLMKMTFFFTWTPSIWVTSLSNNQRSKQDVDQLVESTKPQHVTDGDHFSTLTSSI